MVTTSGLLYLLRDFDQIGKGLKTIEDNIQKMNEELESSPWDQWSKWVEYYARKEDDERSEESDKQDESGGESGSE